MKYLLLPLILLFAIKSNAQHAIEGMLVDENNKAIEFANVLLLKASDSSLVKSTLSEPTGLFVFEGVKAGKYRVAASMVGYAKGMGDAFDFSGEEKLKLKPIVMAQATVSLDEVVISTQKPLIEQRHDKTIMNVENSIIAAGSNALEVLEKAPGVALDQNDNISMRGRQGVIVMIDGKPMPMSGAELANMLKGMSADAVEKIELITNPSSKYDAAGNAGIIDIRLKKDKRYGSNGTVSVSGGHGEYAKANHGLQLNYRNKKVNVFGNYNYLYRRDFTRLLLYRDFFVANNYTGSYDQNNFFDYSVANHAIRTGVDYFISPKTILGLVVSGTFLGLDRENANKSLVLNNERKYVSSFLTDAASKTNRNNQAINFNIKHSIDSTGRELTADLDFMAFQNTDNQNFNTNYYSVNGEPLRPAYLLHGNLAGGLSISSVKVDYTQPLNAIKGSLDVGVKSSLVHADNDLRFYDRSNGENMLDTSKSNHFIYRENINAAYVNISSKLDKLNFQAGLRSENTNAAGRNALGVGKFDKSYIQLFPSASMGYTLSQAHDLGLSLSRRINRPTYTQLNPFKFFLDPSTYSAGNPALNPESTYSLEFSHNYKHKIITKFAYSRTSDVILNVLQPDPTEEKLIKQVFENLATLDHYSINLSAPFSIGNWFNSINNATVYYGLYRGFLANTNIRNARVAYNINSNNNFMLPGGWSAELVGVYRSSEYYGFLDVQPIWFASAGVQKQLWNKKGTLKLNVSDIFYTNRMTGNTELTGFNEVFRQSRDSRVVTLSFMYRFGQNQVAPARRRTSGAEEEKRRAEGN